MLGAARAQAAIVSGSLLPALTSAMVKSDHEVRRVIVAQPVAPLHPAEIEFESLLRSESPAARPARTQCDDVGFWLYSSGSTGRPKGTVHSHANPYWTSELYGKRVLGLTKDDVCFSAAKLFFAYGLGNSLSFPLSVGATTILMGERSTPEAIFRRSTKPSSRPSHCVLRRPRGTRDFWLRHSRRRALYALRLASSAGEALPAEIGQRFTARYGVEVIDGIGSTEMLHIFMSNRPGRVRYGTTGEPVPGYEVELRGEDGRPVGDGEPGDLYIRGPSAALMYWGNRPRPPRPSRAVGRKRATNTFATPMAPTRTPAAQMTC